MIRQGKIDCSSFADDDTRTVCYYLAATGMKFEIDDTSTAVTNQGDMQP